LKLKSLVQEFQNIVKYYGNSRGFLLLPYWNRMPLDPRFAGSNLAEDDGFSRAIKIRNTTSFGRK
jgi:hypothetical protein